ncbi:MAG TPA: RNA 2',3'-cyclic phosphodiesterase [Kofleriaceae bacterium]|nr:RNA 2',3'-cyclic phosphodiesterase [Kofleriaceae bacterium]
MGSKRLFVGVRVSVATANALAACAEMLARRAREAGVEPKWVAPASYHVTLKFLGATRDDAVGAVRDALAGACAGVQPFRFRSARLGAFASLERANVVWAGVEDGATLGELAKRVESALAALGFATEARPFHAHVTLARLREPRPVRELVLPLAEQMFAETRVDAITLFESETKPSGGVYHELARVAFAPAVPPPARPAAADPGDDTDDGWPRR